MICPTYINEVSPTLHRDVTAHLVNNFQPITNLVEGLTKSNTIVGAVHLNEAEEGMARLPEPRYYLIYPRPSDSEVTIRVRGLPRITRKADFSANNLGL